MPHPRRQPLTSAALLLPALAALACSGFHRVDSSAMAVRDHEVPFGPATVRVLELQIHRGFVKIRPGSELRCALRHEVIADTEVDAAALADRIQPELACDGDRCTLTIGVPAGASLQSIETACQIEVPATTATVIRTREGAVTARGTASELEIRGGSGSIEVAPVGGLVRLSSGSGSIDLRGSYRHGAIITERGRVTAVAPAGWLHALELDAGNGEAAIDLADDTAWEVEFRGDVGLIRTVPGVRLEWLQVLLGPLGERHVGRVGPAGMPVSGRLALTSERGTILLRRASIEVPVDDR